VTLLPQTVSEINDRVAQAQAIGRVPSLVAGVVQSGTVVHLAGAGELPVPDPHTQYRIGSITKTLTATLILQLRDAGLLDLDNQLYRYLPGTPVGVVTLRQLLAHVGGLVREPAGDWWERSAGSDLASLMAGLSPEALVHPPFRRQHYSNLAYGLLGAVVEQITGQSWWEVVHERILTPLKMSRTSYSPQEPFARGYVVHPWHGALREEPRYDAGAMAPAGQLWSTVSDLARWTGFVASPDPAVLAAETVDEMCSPIAMLDPDSWQRGQGLGFQMARDGDRVYVGHTGSMPGYLAVFWVHRRSGTAVVAFANAYNMRGIDVGTFGVQLLSAVLNSEPERPAPWRPGAMPPPHVEPLTGRWWFMGMEYEAWWDATRNELVIARLDGQQKPWRFRQEGPGQWRGTAGMNHGEPLTVRRSRSGAVVALDIATFVFTRDPWPAM